MYNTNLTFTQAMRLSTSLVAILLFFVTTATATALTNRIIGGESAVIADHPYMATLRLSTPFTDTYICGAVLITPTAALTAAHCIPFGLLDSVHTLRFGVTDRSERGGQTRRVSRSIRHPQYNRVTKANDIAILVMDEPVVVGGSVQTIRLPTDGSEVAAGTKAWLTGYGSKKWWQLWASDALWAVEVPVWGIEECEAAYNGIFSSISRRVFCAGSKTESKNAYFRDAGSPLVANNILLGLVSMGQWGTPFKKPVFYTNVVKFLYFIEKHVNIKNEATIKPSTEPTETTTKDSTAQITSTTPKADPSAKPTEVVPTTQKAEK